MKRILDWVRGPKLRKRVVYALFFQVVFLLCLALTFPYVTLRDRIVATAENAGVRLGVDSVRPALPLGLTLKGVEWRGGDQPVRVDSLTLRLSLLSVVKRTPALGFSASSWGGTLRGRFEAEGETTRIEAKMQKVSVAQSPLAAFGLDLDGELSEVELRFESEGDLSKANGTLTLKGDSLVLKGGEVQNFELPRIALGALDGKINITQGRANFENFAFEGDDIELRLEGSVRLASKLGSSGLSARLQLKPSEEWWGRNEMLRAAANMALPEDGDGFRTVQIYGQLQSPRFRTR